VNASRTSAAVQGFEVQDFEVLGFEVFDFGALTLDVVALEPFDDVPRPSGADFDFDAAFLGEVFLVKVLLAEVLRMIFGMARVY
jgi:hypothetical protein